MRKKSILKLSLKAKHNIKGYIFIAPFIIGFVFFFFSPILQSLIYSFSEIRMGAVGFTTNYIGGSNYNSIFVLDATFVPILIRTLQKTLITVPMILIFSFFAATLLNQKFKGRAFARAIYFLPVIITSGLLLRYESNSMALVSKFISESQEFGIGQDVPNISTVIRGMLLQSRLDPRLVNYVLTAINQIYEIVSFSGVQILIFLSGLHTVSPNLKEAAYIDGATGWEMFWKITFPMVSPYILVNLVYSTIDTFTLSTNEINRYIHYHMFQRISIGISSAASWSYFLIMIVSLMIIMALVSRKVFYEG